MRSPFRRLSRRTLLALNVALVAASAALLAVTVLALTGEDEEPFAGLPAGAADPGPLVTTIRTESPVGQYEDAACAEEAHAIESPPTWFHPRDYFYPPGADAPTRADLDHLALADGAVVVRYRADAPPAAQEALRRWGAAGIAVIVASNEEQDAPPLEAYTADRRLRCDGVDLDRLTEFTDRHFSRPLDFEPHADRSDG